MMDIYTLALEYEDGLYHGWLFDSVPYVVLRYIGYDGEDEDPQIIEPDWYAIAWVSLLQVLPADKALEIIMDVTFPAKASHLKYFEIVATIDELYELKGIKCCIDRFDGDIILRRCEDSPLE
jgi:hypothetical protein